MSAAPVTRTRKTRTSLQLALLRLVDELRNDFDHPVAKVQRVLCGVPSVVIHLTVYDETWWYTFLARLLYDARTRASITVSASKQFFVERRKVKDDLHLDYVHALTVHGDAQSAEYMLDRLRDLIFSTYTDLRTDLPSAKPDMLSTGNLRVSVNRSLIGNQGMVPKVVP